MDLYSFYTHTAYNPQPEIDAIKQHVEGTVLFVGNYASATLAPHFAESFAATPDQNVLFNCQTNNEADIKYAGAALTHLPYPDDSFDTLVSAYVGSHTDEKILSELKRVAKKKLLIIEADVGSQYVQILNTIQPKPMRDPSELLDQLSEYSVIEESIQSTYTFDKESFVEYFSAEFTFHEDTDIEADVIAQQYVETVGEQAVLLVCQ